jgi:glucosamine--fructose-6-phosphate aminotransferase (isomerizing)
LVTGLQRLEYRGYDSAGVALHVADGLGLRKVVGPVERLKDLLDSAPLAGDSGIGHTRWATRGRPSEANTDPHLDCDGDLALVHNGIIENAGRLRARLEGAGHSFRSDSDAEVLAHLIEEAPGATLEERVGMALRQVEGSYALAVLSRREPGKVVVSRRGAPLVLGVGEGEFFAASDVAALIEHTRSVIYLADGDVAAVTGGGYMIIDSDARLQDREVNNIDWDFDTAKLDWAPHYMLQEIFEQPETVLRAVQGRLRPEEGTARLEGLDISTARAAALERIVIVACGTSWHAALIGRQIIEQLAVIPVQVEYASEYRYQPQLAQPNTLVMAISQSGETADTLEAMRVARRSADSHLVAIVNVVGSTIAREADGVLYLNAGPEIGVASTKAFTAQLTALLLVALYLGRARGWLSATEGKELIDELLVLPARIRQALRLEPRIRDIARIYADSSNFLYLGRGVNFPVALEGSLKLKEISYIHAEGYPAAEMKHGPIALIDEEMPVVFVAPTDPVYPKVVPNIQEVKARSGRVIAICTEGNDELRSLVDHQLWVPAMPTFLSPLVTVIPLQLLAYHIAVLRGCDVDRPRNLTKSVTV